MQLGGVCGCGFVMHHSNFRPPRSAQGQKAVSLQASRNFRFTPKSRHLCEGQLHRRRKGRRCRGVFEKGEEIVFGPDGRLGARHGQGSGDRCFGYRAWPRRLSGLAPAANGLPCRRAAAAIADHMQARRPATISRLSAAPMRHPIRLWT